MTPKLYALVGVLALAGAVSADVCRTGCATTYQPAAVIAAPVVLTLPLYGASYTGDGQDQTEALRAILEELKALRAEMATLKAGGPPAGAQAAPKLDPGKVMVAHCAACHTEGPKKKGDFALFDGKGQLLSLNGPDKRQIEKRVREGTMPPPADPKLSPEERAAVALFVVPPAQPAPAKLPEAKK